MVVASQNSRIIMECACMSMRPIGFMCHFMSGFLVLNRFYTQT